MRLGQRLERIIDGPLVRRVRQHVLGGGERLLEGLPAIGGVVGLLQLVGRRDGAGQRIDIHTRLHQRALRLRQRIQRAGDRLRALRAHQLLTRSGQRLLERLPRLGGVIAAVQRLGGIHRGLQRRRVDFGRLRRHAHGNLAAHRVHGDAVGRDHMGDHAVHAIGGRIGIALGTRGRVGRARGACDGGAVAQPLVRHRGPLGSRDAGGQLGHGLPRRHDHHAGLIQRDRRLHTCKRSLLSQQRGIADLDENRGTIDRGVPVQRVGGRPILQHLPLAVRRHLREAEQLVTAHAALRRRLERHHHAGLDRAGSGERRRKRGVLEQLVLRQRAVRPRDGRLRRLPALRASRRVNAHFRGIASEAPRHLEPLAVRRDHDGLRERAGCAETQVGHARAEVSRLHDRIILQRARHIRAVLPAAHDQVRRHVARERRCADIVARVAKLLDVRPELDEIKIQVPVERRVRHGLQAIGQHHLAQGVARVERAPPDALHALGDDHALDHAIGTERLAIDGNGAVLHDHVGGLAGGGGFHQVQTVFHLRVQHVVYRGVHRVRAGDRQHLERVCAREQVGAARGQPRADMRARHARQVLERVRPHLGDGIGKDDRRDRTVVRRRILIAIGGRCGIVSGIAAARGGAALLVREGERADLRQLVQVATQVHGGKRHALRECALRHLDRAADVDVRQRRAAHERLLAHGLETVGEHDGGQRRAGETVLADRRKPLRHVHLRHLRTAEGAGRDVLDGFGDGIHPARRLFRRRERHQLRFILVKQHTVRYRVVRDGIVGLELEQRAVAHERLRQRAGGHLPAHRHGVELLHVRENAGAQVDQRIGKHDLGHVGPGERPVADGRQTLVELERLQARVVGERLRFDRLHACGQLHALQAGAAERRLANGRQARGQALGHGAGSAADLDLVERRACIERVRADGLHLVGQRHVGKLDAVLERAGRDGGYAVGKHHALHRGGGERLGADGCHALGELDLGKPLGAEERAVADAGELAAGFEAHLTQVVRTLERLLTDGGHAVRDGNALNVRPGERAVGDDGNVVGDGDVRGFARVSGKRAALIDREVTVVGLLRPHVDGGGLPLALGVRHRGGHVRVARLSLGSKRHAVGDLLELRVGLLHLHDGLVAAGPGHPTGRAVVGHEGCDVEGAVEQQLRAILRQGHAGIGGNLLYLHLGLCADGGVVGHGHGDLRLALRNARELAVLIDGDHIGIAGRPGQLRLRGVGRHNGRL